MAKDIPCEHCHQDPAIAMVMPPAQEFYKDVGGELTRETKGEYKARMFLCGYCTSEQVNSRHDMQVIFLKHTTFKPKIFTKEESENTIKHCREVINSLGGI